VVERELEFAAEAIHKAPRNQSPWNYIRGIAKLGGGETSLSHCSRIHRLCQVWYVFILTSWFPDGHCEAQMPDSMATALQ